MGYFAKMKYYLYVLSMFSFLLLEGCSTVSNLPDYVVFNDPDAINHDVLRHPAQPLVFPLSPQDQEIIQILTAKFDQEENCAGLAAPQVLVSKSLFLKSEMILNLKNGAQI